MGLVDFFFGNNDNKEIKRLSAKVKLINELEPSIQALDDSSLRAKTEEFRKRLADGETLDSLLPEAFAVVREAAIRTLGQRHYDVQLIGGMVLHEGRIAEMKTGEGKTIMSTLPVYLNALTGKGVHVVTVNDYLAKRDMQWMGKIYRFLGLTVDAIVHDIEPEERRIAYNCDITYGTNSEFGFDYLRDNMVVYREHMCQRELNYAIVDEVDSILIDEARTPLIISGAGDKSTDMYGRADKVVARLTFEQDFVLDEKQHTINLTEEGTQRIERTFGIDNLSDSENSELAHHINQALRANFLMKLDKDYVVQNDEVVIVDEFTGRLMTGRRYSDGLHQAIEAKEGVHIQRESKTLATITYQNYFRMYKKLAGMTGTAKTEESEFKGIYSLDVLTIPTNREMIRKDGNDQVYRSIKSKFMAVIDEVAEVNKTGQPILVGTVSVEKSEVLSALLMRRGVNHVVLNAKNHEKEAEIVAQAGKINAVTIATNMAGRGTDILLGGNPDFLARREMRKQEFPPELIEAATSHEETPDEQIMAARKLYNDLYQKFKQQTDKEHDAVVALGGLHIIGTERHESRRIDNQLRGRAGRQGDPGSSVFYIALEDDLMRLFGSDRIIPLVESLGIPEDQPIEHKILSKQIETAQKKIEARNYEIRKNVLEYDDVMNKQREIIYKQRRQVLHDEDMRKVIMDMMAAQVKQTIQLYTRGAKYTEEWDIDSIKQHLERLCLPRGYMKLTSEQLGQMEPDALIQQFIDASVAGYEQKERDIAEAGYDMREVERSVLLRSVDEKWMDHIDAMDQLRQGIGLRAYGQRNPVVEYRIEGFDMFEEMINSISETTISTLCHIQTKQRVERKQVAKPITTTAGGEEAKKPAKTDKKVGRNDPCPCGSGRKYKNCCGG